MDRYNPITAKLLDDARELIRDKDLKKLQALPLHEKIERTEKRIMEFFSFYEGTDKRPYLAFSGGKDSTVLLDIIKNMGLDIDIVFCNTGLEYPEIVSFVKSKSDVKIIKPSMKFKDVIERYGYPIISKEQSRYVREIRNTKKGKALIDKRLGKTGDRYALAKSYYFLLNAPFKISDNCCDVIKKRPFKKLKQPSIVGTMAQESRMRLNQWQRHGCISFSQASCKPLSIWTEQDILKYIYAYKIKIASVYGEVRSESRRFELTGVKRTGCMFCMFGLHLEQHPNRFEMMAESHPKIYNYCMKDIEDGGLGLAKIIDFVNKGLAGVPVGAKTIEDFL